MEILNYREDIYSDKAQGIATDKAPAGRRDKVWKKVYDTYTTQKGLYRGVVDNDLQAVGAFYNAFEKIECFVTNKASKDWVVNLYSTQYGDDTMLKINGILITLAGLEVKEYRIHLPEPVNKLTIEVLTDIPPSIYYLGGSFWACPQIELEGWGMYFDDPDAKGYIKATTYYWMQE